MPLAGPLPRYSLRNDNTFRIIFRALAVKPNPDRTASELATRRAEIRLTPGGPTSYVLNNSINTMVIVSLSGLSVLHSPLSYYARRS